MMTQRTRSLPLSCRCLLWASGLGLSALISGGTTAHAQGQPNLPPPPIAPLPQALPPLPQAQAQPLPPPLAQPMPQYSQPFQQYAQPMPPGVMLGAELHAEIQQLRSALLEHRRNSEMLAIRQRNRGLIAGGATLMSLGYIAAIVAGSVVIEDNQATVFGRDTSLERASGGVLFIPVLGPFVSSLIYREPIWSLNWSLVDGMAQVGGLVMMTLGIVSNRKLPAPLAGLQLAPRRTPTGTGSGLALSGSF